MAAILRLFTFTQKIISTTQATFHVVSAVGVDTVCSLYLAVLVVADCCNRLMTNFKGAFLMMLTVDDEQGNVHGGEETTGEDGRGE